MRLATLLLALLALPAAAQAPGAYAVFASQADLDDGGTLSGAIPTCLLAGAAQGISGAFFWDADSQVFAIYDAEAAPGERTQVPVSAFLIDLAAGTNVTTCRDAVPEVGADGVPTGVAFLVLSNSSNEDFVARVDAANQGFSVLTDRSNDQDSGDGISGLAQIGTTLYLARQQFNGAPEDGLYTIDTTTENQIPTPFLLDADLDLTAVASAGDVLPGYIFAISSEFGGGDLANAVLYADLNAPTPALETLTRPCEDDGVSALFTDCTDGGLEDIAVGSYPESDVVLPRLLITNNSFNGPSGETVGSITAFASDDARAIVFTEADLITATGITGYTPSAGSGYLSFTDAVLTSGDPVLYLAGSDEFGGEAGIYSVTAPLPVASEPAPHGAFALAVAPNPAVGAARLAVTPQASGTLVIDVVDALGRTVGTLFRGDAAAGQTLSLATPSLAPGVYTVRVQSGVGVATQRLTVAQ